MSGLPKIDSEYSPSYRRVNVGGIVGGIIAGGIEAVIYSEERRVEDALKTEPISGNRVTIKRTIEFELLIDPMQMKSIQRWLDEKISEYEKIFGRIPSPEEAGSRSKKKTGLE